MAKGTLERIQETVVAEFSLFFTATNSASLSWYLLHSSPMPRVVVKTTEWCSSRAACTSA